METIADFIARTARERQQQDAAAAGLVISTVDQNPDEVAGDMTLARDWAQETGRPAPPMPMVTEFRPVFQQQIEAKRNSTVLAQNPRLAEFLRDPQNAALARDDINGMSYWERVSKSFRMGEATAITQGQEFTRDIGTVLERGPMGRGLGNLVAAADQAMQDANGNPNMLGRLANFARSRAMAADGVPRQMVGGEPVSQDERADAFAGAEFGEVYQGAASLLAEMEKQQFAPMSYKDVSGLGSGLQFISENLSMSLPQMASAMSSGVLSPLLQVLTLGGEANAELKERTDLTEEQRVAVAAGTGMVMAGLDYFGLSRVFGGIPAGQVVTEAVEGTLVDRLVQNGVSEAVGRTMQAALAEGSTEALQEALVVGVTAASGGEYTAEEVVDRLAQGFFAGAGAGGGLRAGGEVVSAGIASRRITEGDEKATAAADNQTRIAEIAEAAAGSKLRARMPDVFRAWVERATENGPAENLYVPADRFVEYFQSIGMDPYALADEMDGVGRSDLEAAIEMGGDLRIPTSTYAARLAGSDADAFFMENMRFDPDEFTSAEARAFEDEKAELMAEALVEAEQIFAEEQELRTFEQEIFDTMVERLRIAGRATDVATTEAALYPAFYKVMAERSGIPLGEFMRRYPLPQVRGDIPQGMQARDVDDLTRTLATARAQRETGVNQPQTPLLEFISNYGGIVDRGGELAARDAEVIRRGRGRRNLRLLRDPSTRVSSASAEASRSFGPDDVAQAAIEAGLMADNPLVQEYRAAMMRGDQVPDITQALFDEIDRELRGEATMTDDDMNPTAVDWDAQTAEMERYLSELGVSLDDDDAVIRQAIEADQAEQRRMYGQDGRIATDSEAFRNWFGDSKVVGPDGEPLVVYHGTNQQIEEFDLTRGGASTGTNAGATKAFFFTDNLDVAGQYAEQAGKRVVANVAAYERESQRLQKEVERLERTANRTGDWNAYERAMEAWEAHETDALYADDAEGQNVVEVYLSIQNPMVVDFEGGRLSADRDLENLIEQAKADGHDGLILRSLEDSPQMGVVSDQFVAFTPTQIKSVNNRGTFDPSDPRILYQAAPAATAGIPENTIVGPDGNPVRMFHGTNRQFETFDGNRIFLTSQRGLANEHALREGIKGARLIETNVALTNPLEIEIESGAEPDAHWLQNTMAIEAALETGEYDGVMIWNPEGDLMIIATDDAQVTQIPQGRTYGQAIPLLFSQEQRGSVAFPAAGVGNGDTVISLFRKADLSTLLHESGHYFLTVMQDMAQKGEASAVTEFETVKSWWRSNAAAVAADAMRVMPDVTVTEADIITALDNGTTGDTLKDAAIDVGMQEQFARGFEAYLMDGKAPSVELRTAFEKFRAWLLSVYRSLRGLNVEVDPEIRGVFDRMLATDAQIAEARAQTGDRGAMFTEAPEGMSPEDWSRYQAIGQAAQDEAAARLLAETMAPIRREAEAAYRAEKEAVRAEVERDVNARREYRAIEWMGNRRWLGDGKPQGMADMRLDRQTLVDRYGVGVLKTLPRGKFTIYANEGGVDPEIAAGLFGFGSADEMIRAMEKAPKRGDAITAEVEKVMFERHGDPLRDGSVEEKAIEAVHGDKRARMLALELDVLRAAPGGTKSAVSVFREMARGTLAGMRVRDAMAANRYLTAERKAGEAAYRASANGDMQGAAEAKRRQLLNHMLYTEAKKIAAEVETAEKLAARLQKKSTREKLAGDYLEAIDEILGRYDFRRISGKAEDRRGALAAFVQRMTDDGRENELAIPERVLQDAQRTPYKRLTVEHLRGVVDSLKNIEHTARLKQKLIDAQSQRDLDAVVDGILGSFDANVKPRAPGRVGTTGERVRAGGRAFLDLVLNAGTLLREIDGFNDLGPAFSNIKAPIDAAMNRLQGRREKAAMDLDALYDVYTKQERRAMAVREFVPEVGTSLSKWERISVALNMGNEGNYQRLTDTKVRGGFTEAQVKAIVAGLDARDAAFVQSVWDYLETFRPDIEAREKRATGVAPKWVDAKPVSIAGVDLRGGYYPLKYDARLSSMARDDATQDIAKSLQAGRFGKAQTRNGHLKERATSSGRPVELDISVLHRHVQQVVYDIELSEPVSNSWRIMQDSRIRDAFVNSGKQADFDALEIWLKDVAEGELVASDVAGQMTRRFKSNFTAAKLAFNLSTVAVQITGLAQSMVVTGKRDFLRGVQASLRPGVAEEVAAKSRFMRDRQTTFNKDIFDLYNDPRLGPVASRWTEIRNDWIAPAGFFLMTKVQFYSVDMPTWLAGYQQGLGKFGNDEAKAIAYADDVVKRAQASGIFSDRSAVERGSASMRARQNEFLRLFTTLGSYMFAKFNVAYERTGRARQVIEREGVSLRSAQEAVSWTIDVAFLFTLEAVMYAAIKGRLPDEEDDEDNDGMADEWAGFLAKESALSLMSTIPFVRDIGSVLTGFGGGGAYGAITEELARPLIQMGQGEADLPFVKSVINATGLFTGLPAGQINRAVDAGWRQAEGEDVSPVEYLLGRMGN